jgi:hypothetical protein
MRRLSNQVFVLNALSNNGGHRFHETPLVIVLTSLESGMSYF